MITVFLRTCMQQLAKPVPMHVFHITLAPTLYSILSYRHIAKLAVGMHTASQFTGSLLSSCKNLTMKWVLLVNGLDSMWRNQRKVKKPAVIGSRTHAGHLWLEPPVLCHLAKTVGRPPTVIILYVQCMGLSREFWSWKFRSAGPKFSLENMVRLYKNWSGLKTLVLRLLS